ncbi:ABC transporter ATP-binding protein [Cryptosporangium arvum]|uniref:ABC-type bacteriocin/lantibiotic exporter with N-terminal double-glycine peptidase domain n=1 Tax=Cryptosporangium arvum DSM 44712 TaxID=927661 RepID=A0A010ZVG4_9ACTN|nr:ABC transporter ATP-binding protein [Cryptosporangium arvum]EXG82684.1 ABC-type bacteriocin/lantibiotic exporter with N-terminal double-glycine peptidase domain [Cryptosporangium arvum DSM 44712]
MRAAAGMAAGIAWRSARRPVVLLTLVALVGAAAPVGAAWATRGTIDRVATSAPLGELVAVAVALAVAGIATATLPQLEQYLQAEVARATNLAGAERLHSAVGGFVGLGRFEDPRFLDRLQLAGEGERAAGAIVGSGLASARSLLALGGFVGSLLVLSPAMTLVVLVAAVPTLVAEFRLSRARADMTFDISPVERRELFYRNLLTSSDAAKEIRLFGIAAFLRTRMLTERRTADDARRRIDRRDLVTQGGLALFGALVAGGGLVWAVRAARQGTLSIGDVSLFLLAIAGVQGALAGAISQLAQLHHQLLMFGHFRAVVTAESDLPVAPHPTPVRALTRGIELRDVWFRYGPDAPWALRGVTLTIPQGRATALAGRNGSGKSTLIKLLCRFYDPDRGTIRWDGVDLRELDPAALRERITAVFQDFVEYDLTAAENIGLGDLAGLADEGRIRAAARRAGVDAELAGLPAGYRTLLSRMFFTEADREDPSTGVVLSGGQWQRVAVARAFLRDRRDLMILDEPSAGLDAEAEYRIHAGLREHRAGRTSLLISHRMGSLRDADRILVLDGGELAEEGTHAQLLAADGVYARLFRLQAAGYADEPVAAP